MTTFKTTFETTGNKIEPIEIFHGENADLVTSITDAGIPISLSGYVLSAIYQPSGLSDYYSCPCSLDEKGNAVVNWTHLQDNGASTVRLWLYAKKEEHVSYPAVYYMQFLDSPGFTPSSITPVPPTLDFSLYTLLNSPYTTSAMVSAIASSLVVPSPDPRVDVLSTSLSGLSSSFVSHETNNNIHITYGATGAGMATNSEAIHIGDQSESNYRFTTAVGAWAKANAYNSIQLGGGENISANTFQVWEHTLLNKNTGRIPIERITPGSGCYPINNVSLEQAFIDLSNYCINSVSSYNEQVLTVNLPSYTPQYPLDTAFSLSTGTNAVSFTINSIDTLYVESEEDTLEANSKYMFYFTSIGTGEVAMTLKKFTPFA